ncbi:hypothetical protein TNCT_256231 [Trichonephila clavata]|uniref:Uncharacterized protein n=1 Tax=Trichonephila clavata TaxID=2740835 RepID=A0A8X6G4E5_TRICU|nr:hypothetical protein TNCT_256231 [Trichonephila clavata]
MKYRRGKDILNPRSQHHQGRAGVLPPSHATAEKGDWDFKYRWVGHTQPTKGAEDVSVEPKEVHQGTNTCQFHKMPCITRGNPCLLQRGLGNFQLSGRKTNAGTTC